MSTVVITRTDLASSRPQRTYFFATACPLTSRLRPCVANHPIEEYAMTDNTNHAIELDDELMSIDEVAALL